MSYPMTVAFEAFEEGPRVGFIKIGSL